ncbi:MAG TPA: four helix bundle protein [bacterium]|nr:four helix bundle protein [bacterium]
MGKMKNRFENLDVWKQCRSIRKNVWNLCKTLPSDEKYMLKNQMIRASRSVTANIAEGYGRYHYQENIQFCRQGRGSLYELIDHVLVAQECNYINENQAKKLLKELETAIRLMNGYIKYLRSKKNEK